MLKYLYYDKRIKRTRFALFNSLKTHGKATTINTFSLFFPKGVNLDEEESIDSLFGTLSLDKYQQNSKLQRSPFDKFKISSTAILNTLNSRSLCPKCARSMKYFCYWCYQVVGCQRSDVPYLKLPIKIDVWDLDLLLYFHIFNFLFNSVKLFI